MRTANWQLRALPVKKRGRIRARPSWRELIFLAFGLTWILSVSTGLRDLNTITGGDYRQMDELRGFPLSVRVTATPDSPLHWSMLHGFGQPESDGTWVVSLEGALEIELPDGADSLLLELYPFLPEGVVQRTIAIRSGQDVQLVGLADGITVVRIQADANARQRVVIECDYAVSPFVLGEGPDKRTLCVKLLSIEARPTKPIALSFGG